MDELLNVIYQLFLLAAWLIAWLYLVYLTTYSIGKAWYRARPDQTVNINWITKEKK